MPVDPAEIARKRREAIERLQPKKMEHRQRKEELWKMKANGGNFEVKTRIKENELARGHPYELFLTPVHVADDMVDRAGIQPGMVVLEPEAGTGRIALAIRRAGVEPVCVEFSQTNCEYLRSLGFQCTQDDFLQYNPPTLFDAILMNPPFSNLKDVDHVLHAYTLLKPGAPLVAITSESPFIQQRDKAVNFRKWLEDAGGYSEQLPEGTFKESETGVNARLVVVHK